METRNFVTSLLVATAVLLIYLQVVQRLAPRTQPPPAETPTSQIADAPSAADEAAPAASRAATASAGPELRATSHAFSTGRSRELITVGGAENPDYPLSVAFTPVGGGIAEIDLTARDKKGRFIHRRSAESKDPYPLVRPLPLPGGDRPSFVTYKIWIAELNGGSEFVLADLPWEVIDRSDTGVAFATTLSDADGNAVLRLTKRYTLSAESPLIDLSVSAENLTATPLTVTLAHDGAVGIEHTDRVYDLRKVIVARQAEGQIELDFRDRNGAASHPTLLAAGQQFAWAASMDRYFAVFVRLLPRDPAQGLFTPDVIRSVEATTLFDQKPEGRAQLDAVLRMFTRPERIEPRSAWTTRFEIYAGPKDPDVLKRINTAFVTHSQLGYDLAQSADSTCMCTFHWLTSLMTALLRGIYFIVRNYGVAIICLVFVVRGLLHPLAVFQQKSMYRMQEGMARLQPKMAAIKEKYANDKVKQNQELMRLMGEEGVNPAGNMVAFIPIFLQMPILVALWQALSTDIELRLAPFDGWWIRDLSAPDALIRFGENGITIPILGWLPLIGPWFSHIQSLNLLPILMGIAMYLQQKYMPKPKIERPADAPPPKPTPGALTPEEQQRQQQMVANMMSVMMPVMFYNFPSGLCLYWLTTNVFGIFESMRIRKQIEADKARRAALGPQAVVPRQPGPIARWMKRLAEQAEEVQRRADQLSRENDARGRAGGRPSGKRTK